MLWHGARVPLCYHPAYPIKVPHGDKERHRMRAERRELIQQLFCSIMDDIEGGLVWLRLRMRVISAELVFDSVMQTLPFFKTRVAEAKEIFEKEKSCGKRADEEQYDEEAELCRMLLPPMSSCALPRFIRLMVKVIANPPSASSAHDKSQWGLFFLGELFPST